MLENQDGNEQISIHILGAEMIEPKDFSIYIYSVRSFCQEWFFFICK